MGNISVPERRARMAQKSAERVRRKYKVVLSKQRKYLPGEYPHVVDTVIVLHLAGYSQAQICRVVGISNQQVSEIIRTPEISERIVKIRSALPQAALNLLQGYMVEAVQAIVDVMRSSRDDKLVLQAAGEILDRSGVPKASRSERHQVNELRTTFTDDGIVERIREASPELQEQAAQVIEQLENLLNSGSENAD